MAAPNSTAGNRNCQAETPAARATTNSLERDSRQKAIIEPNRMTKGSVFWSRKGNCNNASSTASPASPDARRSCSTKLIRNTRPPSPTAMIASQTTSWRAI